MHVEELSVPISDDLLNGLCCPRCRGSLQPESDGLRCRGICRLVYPIVDGVPILIDDGTSVFARADFTARRDTTFYRPASPVVSLLSRCVPTLSRNVKAARNYDELARLLLAQTSVPRVLVLGGSILGAGFERLLSWRGIRIVETDVSFGPRTRLVCDAHDIPFENGTFDGVVAQSVLQHVSDARRCVEEIHRVLKPGGLLYAEVPFVQQGMGRYDFLRFTLVGQRRLFRSFEEIGSGAVGGPAMALAWSYEHFLMSFVRSRGARRLVHAFAGFTAFWLKYLDPFLVDRPGALEAASGYYFLGRRSLRALSDREVLDTYRGLQ
jgi:SAM-dependent methyltransferase